jgi:hypothetical protein
MRNYLLFLVVGVFIMSCTDESDDANVARQVFIGAWDVTSTVAEYSTDTLVGVNISRFEAHFLADGTGYTKAPSGFKSIYDWYYQHEPAAMILVYHGIGPLGGQTTVHTVHTNESDSQIWTHDSGLFNDPDVLYRHTWSMMRK